MSNLAVVGPLGEGDLGDELRLHPVRVFAKPPGRRRRERALCRFELVQRRSELARAFCREAGPDLAGEDQIVAVVVADEQRADSYARPLRIREAADDELLPANTLGLQPPAALSEQIGEVPVLGDDPLESQPARFAEGDGAVGVEVVAEEDSIAFDDLPQRLLPYVERLGDEIAPVEVEKIEDEVHQPSLGAVLKRLEAGAAVGEDHADLAVEEGGPGFHRPRGTRDFLERFRPVLAVSAQQGDAAVLDAAADAIAVVLHLVDPVGSRRRGLDQLRQLRLVRRYASHLSAPKKGAVPILCKKRGQPPFFANKGDSLGSGTRVAEIPPEAACQVCMDADRGVSRPKNGSR
jgi:hypothetical protein